MHKIIIPVLIAFFIISCNSSNEHDVHSQEKDSATINGTNDDAETKKATFVHTVFFWMKEDLSEKEAVYFESEMDKLGQTPSILSYKWGKPAGTPREVVDNSYTYAWIVDFASIEDQDAYQVDPIHLAFIENCQDLWTKVQVYDTIIE